MRYLFLLLPLLFSSVSYAQETTNDDSSWSSDSEIGYVSQSGNTEQENAFIKTMLSKKFDKDEIKANAEYINSSGKNQDTNVTSTVAESSLFKLQYIYGSKTLVRPFASALWERNRFAGFDNRYAGDVGAKYTIIDEEDFTLSNETGYRYRAQYAYTVGDVVGEKTESQFARIYFGLAQTMTKTSNFKFFIETLYDFNNTDNVEITFEPSLDVFLGEFFPNRVKPAQISLRVSYRGIFDNVPAQEGLQKYDSTLSTGIKVVY